MNEVSELVGAFDEAVASGRRCALAILVSVEGSSYRRPGARMLICEDGYTTGTISAGCLESDLIEHAKRVISNGRPKLVEYNTTSTSDEMAWGLGLGCNGIVRVLVEPLSSDSLYIDSLRNAVDRADETTPTKVVTIYESVGSEAEHEDGAIRPGARVVIDADGACKHERLEADTARAFEQSLVGQLEISQMPGANAFAANGSIVRVFVEVLLPPVPLIVFGAGHDALPIVELASGLGWRVEVVDPQQRPASVPRFSRADKVTLSRPEDVAANVTVTPRTVAILMTHNYAHDLELLEFLLASPATYVGVMGPKKRTTRMLGELRARQANLVSDENLERLFSPVGLDIGANSPFEIALSIVSEMKAVLNGRAGGLLRERHSSIHGRAIDAEPFAIAKDPATPAVSG